MEPDGSGRGTVLPDALGCVSALGGNDAEWCEAGPLVLFGVVAPAMPFSGGVAGLLRQWIETHTSDAGQVVYLLSQIGNLEDRAFLRQRLEKLHSEEKATLSAGDGRLEIELVTAQIRGRTWDYSGEKGKEIPRLECKTMECKQYFRVESWVGACGSTSR